MNRKEELEKLLATAEAHRKTGYQKKVPRFIIQSINADIRNFRAELAEIAHQERMAA